MPTILYCESNKLQFYLDGLKQIALDLSIEQNVGHLSESDAFSVYKSFLANPKQSAGMRFAACLTKAKKITISVDRNKLEFPPDSECLAAELPADELPAKALR